MSMNEAVKKHWEAETCGVRYGASEDRGEWFREIERARYLCEPQILEFAEFKKFRAKRVLEIGVGAGTDFKNWVKNGAQATGIDLTSRGTALTKERLSLEGINPNRFNLCVADSERLPFKDGVFEMVYSWGVLHHTLNTGQAIKEAYRVLKPGGIIKAMVYHIPSWTGWLLWLRFCLFKLRPWISPRKAIYGHLESPGTKAYTLEEAKELFESARFQVIEIKTSLGPGDLLRITFSRKYGGFIYKIIGLMYPRWLVRLFGNRFGLELLLQARK